MAPIGIGLGLSITRRLGSGGGSGPAAPVPAIWLGQSELEYLFNAGTFYRQITQPTPGDGNLVVWTQGDPDAAPVKTTVNAASVAAGSVNPAMAAMSAWLAKVTPGKTYLLGDACVAGTSRYALVDDTESDRKWTDLTAVVNAIEAEAGAPIKAVIECWYNSDAASIVNFKNSFWPMYFGRTGADGAFTLGNTNPAATNTSARFDHCVWDAAVAPGDKGRGIFARTTTKWRVCTPMVFCDAPVAPSAELTTFSAGLRLSEPARATMIALAADALAQSVDMQVGPSAHIVDFDAGIHPIVTHQDGQILLMWPLAMRLAQLGGFSFVEPTVVGVDGPTDGSYVDVLIDLPNGGSLTTLRALRSLAAPSVEPPHYQPVVGMEMVKSGTRRPVYKTAETSYPASHRGTVAIVDAGSGSPRRGKVRITPSVAFGYGDAVSYLRGQASGHLLELRDPDAKLYLDMLIEHVSGWYDAGALYPCPGIAVRPYQADLTVPVPAPPFSPQSTRFNGSSSGLSNTSMSFSGSSEGTIAFWYYERQGTWASPTAGVILQIRNGTTITLEVKQTSSGRMTFDAKGATAYTTPTSAFTFGRWHHVVWSYKAGAGGWNQISVDGAAPLAGTDLSAATLTINAAQTRCYVGNSAATLRINADVAYAYAHLGTALDLSVQANREKFVLAKQPVYLGANGELPTGTTPHFMLDGGASMVNLGSAGSLTPTDLVAGATPALP